MDSATLNDRLEIKGETRAANIEPKSDLDLTGQNRNEFTMEAVEKCVDP